MIRTSMCYYHTQTAWGDADGILNKANSEAKGSFGLQGFQERSHPSCPCCSMEAGSREGRVQDVGVFLGQCFPIFARLTL